jgi:two-component system, NarL family, invasion response regulator UvrY
LKILLADDHTLLRQSLGHLLAETISGATVGEAATAEETFARIQQEHWDVLVLDIKLPGRNGLDVLKVLHSSHPKLPVLVLSGYAEDDYAVRAIRAGAAGYLTKDQATQEVIQAVQKVHAGGKYITPSVADKLATALTDGNEPQGHEALSDREYQVLQMIVAGKTMTEIAAELFLSIKTVSTYRRRIAEKTGMKTDAELTKYALKHQLMM